MNRALSFLLTALALLTFAAERARATDPDVASPLVSYQYLDSLADPPAEPNVVSPLVSYQYLDWPGDENLTFQSSQNVSYYFSGGVVAAITGYVRTASGVPVAGATITLKRYGTVFWTGMSDVNGSFSAPGLLAADYVVLVTKAGYLTATGSVAGEAGGNLVLNIELAPLPPALAVVDTNRVPEATAFRAAGPGMAHLRVLKSSQFTTNFSFGPEFDPGRPTIVLSHGWLSGVDRPGAGDWVLPMALQIRSRIGAGAANIVAWDWSSEADRSIFGAIDVGMEQGEALGQALREKLGAGYSQHLHFIGHSLGTIVNATACDYVHGRRRGTGLTPAGAWQKAQTTPQVTLLDEAEIAEIGGRNVIVGGAALAKLAGLQNGLLGFGIQTATGWKDPIPKDYAWIDNYISAVGFHRDEAVNVCLLAPTLTFQLSSSLGDMFDQAVVAHSYAHLWYRNTISPSASSAAIGFGSSLESGAIFPPSGTGKTPGSEWYEHLNTPDPFDLTQNPFDLHPAGLFVANVNVPILKAGTVLSAAHIVAQTGNDYIYEPIDALGRSVLDGYEMGVQFVGNIGGTVIYKTGQVISTTTEKVGLWWDAGLDRGGQILNSLNPSSLITGPLAAPVFKIRLKTQAAPQPLAAAAKAQLAAAPLAGGVGEPSYAWMTVEVPADAIAMAFDFTVTGDPHEDVIACAINEQNVFSLPARFAPDGETASTDLIDVSAYAGQTVELFFGLAGGTSTDCEVAIDGVRFVTVPSPKLAIGTAGNSMVLKWPAAATGWVLETSDSLAPGSWTEVPSATPVVVDQGVATVEPAASGLKRFWRLRRIP